LVIGKRQNELRRLLKRRLFVSIQVRPIVFGEPERKDRTSFGAKENQRSVAAGFSGPRPRHALLDQTSAEIGVYQSISRSRDGVAKCSITECFLCWRTFETKRF
jgi:hypothetical protein